MGISSLDCSQVLKSPFVRIMLTIKNQAPSFMTMCEFCNVWKEEVNELNLHLTVFKNRQKGLISIKISIRMWSTALMFACKHGHTYIVKLLLDGKRRHFWSIFILYEACFWFLPNFWVIKLPFSRPIIRGLNPSAHLYLSTPGYIPPFN